MCKWDFKHVREIKRFLELIVTLTVTECKTCLKPQLHSDPAEWHMSHELKCVLLHFERSIRDPTCIGKLDHNIMSICLWICRSAVTSFHGLGLHRCGRWCGGKIVKNQINYFSEGGAVEFVAVVFDRTVW